jgi:hypothetical protein
MTFNLQSLADVHAFYGAIAPWQSGYQHNSFAYVARKESSGNMAIGQAMLWLNSTPSKITFNTFETENVCAGHFRLADVGKSFRELIQDLGTGTITTPDNRKLFFEPVPGEHGASFSPLHPAALQSQSRLNVLKLTAGPQVLPLNPSVLDWELRGAETPFDTINELLSHYSLGGVFRDFATIEVIASSIMGFNGDASKISGETATIVVNLANTLDPEKALLGYREINPGKTHRGRLSGSQFKWNQSEQLQTGTFELPVAKGAILHCYAIYNNVAQTHWYISDPTTSQNPRRAIFESFDTGLAILNEFLGRSRTKGRDARDLEAGVAWLFWMLGFSTAQLGSTARTQDFSDLILQTPQGQMAIVECTTGLLRADSKLPKLVARAASVRQRLNQSGHAHVKLLSVIVSSLPREELQADIDDAEKLGVVVIAREELDQAVNRTLIAANADDLFSTAERQVEASKSKLRTVSEPELPLT